MIRALLAAFLCLTLWTASTGARAAERLTIGITQYPSTLHPMIDSMQAKSYVLGLARRPITEFGADWKLMCMLCTDVPTLDNGRAVLEKTPDGGDGIAVTYTLKEGLAWGDGTPLTTKDVRFTWEVGKHPQSGVTSGELFRRILSIDTIDERTFTLHLDRVEFEYAAINDFEVLPAHIERPIFEADPAAYRNRTAYATDPTNPGLYHGPYRIAQVERGAHIVLERNPTWAGPAPAFETIVVKAIENTAALEANLLSGGVDMVSGELGFSTDQALAFEKRHGAAFDITYKAGLIYEHLDLNLDNPILADKRVRRALLLGLDREAINAQLFAGKHPVAHGNVSPLDRIFDRATPKTPFAPGVAAKLLDEAGWTIGPDGVRVDASGARLRLELMTTAGNRTRELVEQIIQSQWKAIGIEVTIRNEPPRVFFGETTSKRKFPGLALFAWISAPESVPRTTLHSTMIPTADNAWQGQNYTGYANPEMDKLIDAIEVELDPEARAEMWSELQRLYARDLPALPLYWRANAFIVPKWLKGLEPTGHMAATTLWVENWRVER